ncbi:hypothetical protein [uncultured Sneathiella sp.]|uniref:hypothetical protein n=1 Tax=uncultured Sneathiella sp. TaxID=879315 RepID=UPI002595DCFD|nr:hypothetical protein [uncultured Sneathiella sp.]
MKNSPTLMDKIRKNPAEFFDTPHDVTRDNNLTLDQQNDILKAWEDDVKALLRAESENMPASEKQAKPTELLSTISKLRAEQQERQRD